MRVELRPDERPWMVRAKFDYSAGLVKRLGAIPGCKWLPLDKEWVVPIEIAEDIFKYETPQQGGWTTSNIPVLHPYQRDGINSSLNAPGRRWFFTDEMGLGKTAQAIIACDLLSARRILVICPASVRR